MILQTVTKVYDQLINNKVVGYRVTNSQNDEVTFVPLNEANSDYQAIQEWAEIEGNNIIDNGA
tara:strand:- start:49 stop:237 length:189 start_codon:yes stop_codon:yes gene_type:complete